MHGTLRMPQLNPGFEARLKRSGHLFPGAVAILVLFHALLSLATTPTTKLPAGQLLRVALDHRYSMQIGTQLEGHLISAVYLVDHIVLPVDTPVYGVVVGRHSVERRTRINAMLDGDFTPLAEPEIVFERLQLPDGTELRFDARAVQRNAVVVRMTAATRDTSLKGRVKTEWDARRQAAMSQWASAGKSERVRQYVYRMLPYHPQNLWTGEQFDAELSQALDLPDTLAGTAPLPVLEFGKEKPTGVIEARLTRTLTSARCPVGMTVEAILSKPLFDHQREHILLPQGTILSGSIVESRPAAMFGRNGRLRFSFRRVELADNSSAVRGIVVAAEGTPGDNLSIDSEGGARATTPNRTLGTLTLAVLAAASHGDRDERSGSGSGSPLRSAVVSNGFGIIGRIASVASGDRDVASGFAYYALAKNVYRRWIARGKDVTFPRNTSIQIDLASR